MDASEISDEDSLRAWLVDQPRETAIVIAHRAAMRVAPLFWRKVSPASGEGDLTALGVCRANLICGVAGTRLTPPIRVAADSAAAAAAVASTAPFSSPSPFNAADAAINFTFIPATRSASADAAFAAAAAAESPIAACVASSSAAADFAASAALWRSIANDAGQFLRSGQLLVSRLWREAENPMEKQWHSVAAAWLKAGPDWDFWRRWYQAALDGEPLGPTWDAHWDLLEQIALIDPATWESGPAAVAEEIRRIEETFEQIEAVLDLTPNGEQIVLDSKTGLIKALPVAEIDGNLRDHILATVTKEIGRFRTACKASGTSNFGLVLHDCAEADLGFLEEDLAENTGYDFGLHQSLDICLNALRRRFDEQGVQDDPAAQRLLRALERCVLDIHANSAEVRDLLEKRSDEIYRQISLEHAAEFNQLCADMAADSVASLRQQMLTDIDRADDADADPAQRRRSRHNTLSRLPRGARAVQYSRFEDGQRVVDDPVKPPRDRLWVATVLGPPGAVLLSHLLGLL